MYMQTGTGTGKQSSVGGSSTYICGNSREIWGNSRDSDGGGGSGGNGNCSFDGGRARLAENFSLPTNQVLIPSPAYKSA